jgi:hypothetical protein
MEDTSPQQYFMRRRSEEIERLRAQREPVGAGTESTDWESMVGDVSTMADAWNAQVGSIMSAQTNGLFDVEQIERKVQKEMYDLAYEDTKSQLFEAGIGGLVKVDRPDGTHGIEINDPKVEEFVGLRASAYSRGDEKALGHLRWSEYDKGAFAKWQARYYGFMHDFVVGSENLAGSTAAGVARWAHNIAFYSGDGNQQVQGMASESRSPDQIEADREDVVESARKFGRDIASSVVSRGNPASLVAVRGIDPDNPEDARAYRGRAGGGFWTSTAEMTGSALASLPYSVPALMTRNPKAAALLTSPFFFSASESAYQNRLSIWKEQDEAARSAGLPRPARPSNLELMSQAAFAGGAESVSETVGNVIQVPIIMGAGRVFGKVQAARVAPQAVKETFDGLSESMARHRGPLGTAKKAAKAVVDGAKVAGIEAVEEAFPQAAQEISDAIWIPAGYESDFFSESTAEAMGTGFIAGGLMFGGIAPLQSTMGKEARESRARSRMIKDAEKRGLLGAMAQSMIDKQDRIARENLVANSAYARTEAMVMHAIDEVASGRRSAVLVPKDDSDNALTSASREQMDRIGLVPIGVVGLSRDNPNATAVVYAHPSMREDVMSAANAGDVNFLFGRNSTVGAGEQPTVAVVTRNSARQIVDVLPFSRSEDAEARRAAIEADAATSGLSVEVVDSRAFGGIEQSIREQRDAQSAIRVGSVVRPSVAQRNRGINSLRLEMRQSALGSKSTRGPSGADDAPFASRLLTAKETNGATNKDVEVDIELSEVSDESLAEGESDRLLSPVGGVKPTVLDAKVVFRIRQKDGSVRTIEKDTENDGAYLAQSSPDGVFLLRKAGGTAFTRRNAFATLMHELRHKGAVQSRASAEYMGHLLFLDPDFALRGGLDYMLESTPDAFKDAEGNPMTEEQVLVGYAAQYGASVATLADADGYQNAVKTLRDPNASQKQKESASQRIREQDRAYQTRSTMERFAEESVAQTQTGGLGQTAQAGAEWLAAFKDKRERSLRSFGSWMAYQLAKRGFAGPQARQALYEIEGRMSGKLDSEMRIFDQARRETEARYRKGMRAWLEAQATQPAPEQGGGGTSPDQSERGMAGGASFSRRPLDGAQGVPATISSAPPEEPMREAGQALEQAGQALMAEQAPTISALANAVSAMASVLPMLTQTLASVQSASGGSTNIPRMPRTPATDQGQVAVEPPSEPLESQTEPTTIPFVDMQSIDPRDRQAMMSLRPIKRSEMTPEMAAWSEGSQVVDENGDLIPVFHGTSKDTNFNTFRIGKRGAWFTTDPDEASQYAVSNDSMNLKREPTATNPWAMRATNTASRVIPAVLNLKNPANYETDLSEEDKNLLASSENYYLAQGRVFEKLRFQGFDGVSMGYGVYVAFQPNQIKGYFNERPTQSPQIMGSRRTLRGEWWLTDSGPLFADGDVGDMNHEMLAQQEAVRDLASDFRQLASASTDDALKSRLEQFDARIEEMDQDNGWDFNEAQDMVRDLVGDEGLTAFMESAGVPQEQREQFRRRANFSMGLGDPREYGFDKNWVRVQGNNIQMRGLNDSSLRSVADQLYEAEGEQVLDQVFTVEDMAARRTYDDVPFEALEKGIRGLAPYRGAQYSRRGQAQAPDIMGSRRKDPFAGINKSLKARGFDPEQRLRIISAASAMSVDDAVRPANPIDWLRSLKKNKAARTLTPYTLSDLNKTAGQVLSETIASRNADGKTAPIQLPEGFDADEQYMQPFRLNGVDAGFAIKRVLEFADDGTVSYDGYEAVGLFSNDDELVTGIVAPTMLFIIGFNPDKPMRGDCYNVIRNGLPLGKLPSLYMDFGAQKTWEFPFDPNYPDLGATPEDRAEAVRKLESVWKTPIGGNWKAERDEAGNVTNYPSVWGFEFAITPDQRRSIAAQGLSGYLANPRYIAEMVTGSPADGSVDSQQRNIDGTAAGRLPDSTQVPVSGSTGGATQAGGRVAGRNALAGGGVFRTGAGGTERVDLSRLAVEIKRIGNDIRSKRGSAKEIGRLLSASRLLPSSSRATDAQIAEITALEQKIADLKRDASDPKTKPEDKKALKKRANAESKRLREMRESYAGDMAEILGLTSLRELGSTERRKRRKAAEAAGTGEVVRMGVAGLQERLDMYSRAVANMVGEMVRRDGGLSPFMQEVMAEAMAADMDYAMTKAGSHKNAAEWYRNIVKAMMEYVRTKYAAFSNAEQNPAAESVFSIVLAITSNGEKVLSNMRLTRTIFEQWLSTGRVEFPSNVSAKRGGSMSSTLQTLEMIRQTMQNKTWAEVRSFLLTRDKFKNLNKKLVRVRARLMSDIDAKLKDGSIDAAQHAAAEKNISALVIQDSADDVGYMAAIMGPKIGSFFANLNGLWDTLTADVWFVRTFARIIGNLMIPDNVATQSAIADIIALKDTFEAQGLGWDDSMVDAPDEILEWAKTVEDDYMRRRTAQQQADGTILQKTPLELAATRLTKAVVKSSAAPKSRSERSLMRDITTDAVRIAKKRYEHDIELASAQALLWYVEKELYETYAAGQDVAGQDFEQAAKAVFDQQSPTPTPPSSPTNTDPLTNERVIDPMMSMRRGARGVKDEATLRYLDRFDEVLRATRVAEERTGTALADVANPYLGARLLQGNIAQQQLDAEARYADILYRQNQAGIALEDMDRFLYAQHAEERNRYIARIDPTRPDGGSGMTNREAADEIADVARSGRLPVFERFADEWRMMLQEALDARRDAGLVRPEVYAAINAEYKRYVPLRGIAARDPWDADFGEMGPQYGRGLSTTGRGMPMAAGRRSQAAGITSQVAYVHEDTIRRIAKNDVGQRFLRMMLALNDRAWGEFVRPTRRIVVDGAVRVVHDQTWTNDGRHFGVYIERPMTINGHDYAAGDMVVIRINNRRLADAMLSPSMDLRAWERGLRAVNNVWRYMTTGPANPAFAPVNMLRDVGTATLNNMVTRGFMDTAGMLSRWPLAFARVMRDEWLGNGNATGTYRRFLRAGGGQVYWKENDLDVKRTDFEALARRVERRDPNDRTLAKTLFGWYTAFFAAAETASRLAQFEQRVAAGDSVQNAALAGRDITVDFAKGGLAKPALNTWYVFANAALQGNANIISGLLRNPVRAAITIPHLILFGYVMSAMARAMGGEDEERGQSRWDNIPDYEKTAKLFFFEPFGSGKYISLPMPYGYNVLVSAGVRLEAAINGTDRASDVIGGMFNDALAAFNPIGGSGIKSGTEGLLTSLAPTMARPLAEIVANTDFAGRPIYREQMGRVQQPDSQMAFDSTPEGWRTLAQALNSATGGDEFESGKVDASPDTMRYLAGYYLSGTGRILDRLYTAMSDPSEAELNDIPIMRSFVGDAANDKRSVSQQYYEIANSLAPTALRVREVESPTSPERLQSAVEGLDPEKVALNEIVAKTENELRKLRQVSKSATPEQQEAIAAVRRALQTSVIKQKNLIDKASRTE